MKQVGIAIAILIGIIFGIFIIFRALGLIFAQDATIPITPQAPENRTESTEETGVTVQEIVEDPQVYEGLEITITGIINDWVSKKAFTISSAERFDDQLLLLSRIDFPNPEDVSQEQLALGDNSRVEATGIVRIFTREQLQQDLSTELEEELFASYEDQPVFLIKEIKEVE